MTYPVALRVEYARGHSHNVKPTLWDQFLATWLDRDTTSTITADYVTTPPNTVLQFGRSNTLPTLRLVETYPR